jgi:hypothetical protein
MITGREIGERFIRAVQIMEGSYYVGPARGGSSWVAIPYTQADKNGWGSERLSAERQAFWNSINNAPKPWEVSEAEQTLEWVRYVTDEDERLCLMSWASCMAEGGLYFKDWCKARGIHVETGRRRKERAILRILLALHRKPLLHNENDVKRVLPDPPEIGDKGANIDEARVWRDKDITLPGCEFDASLRDFSWAEGRNQIRRQREAERRKRDAA